MSRFLSGVVRVLAAMWSHATDNTYVGKVPAIHVTAPNRPLNLKSQDVCRIDVRNIGLFGQDARWTGIFKDGKFDDGRA